MNNEIKNILPLRIREVVNEYFERNKNDVVEEIRLRCNKPVLIVTGRGESELSILLGESELREVVEYISGYSLYAYEEQLREGFITIRGGHRIGVAGKIIVENEKIKTIKNISSINIRISHEILGCSNDIMKYLKGNILIISPPRMGKTTLLRDILRNISERKGECVGIVDERSEIAACYLGIPQNNLGKRCDVLDCCPKAIGMILLLRSMSPTYIGVDELGTLKDIESIKHVINSGSGIVATIHGENIENLKSKQSLKEIFELQLFDTYIELKKEFINGKNVRVINVFDKNFKEVKD